MLRNTGWISPEGKFYECKAHEVLAEELCQKLYNIEDGGGDILINLGWVKVSASCMFSIYKDRGFYDHFASKEQEIKYKQWYVKYGQAWG